MHANRRRGETVARLDGTEHRLCLTLGALAELETAFGVDDLGDLASRFSSGRFSARDLARIVAAGLRGAGETVADEDVLAMRCAEGVGGFVAIVADLLSATFDQQGEGQSANP